MAIGYSYLGKGSLNNNAGNTIVVTTLADVNVGDVVVWGAWCSSSQTLTGVTDSGGNTYTPISTPFVSGTDRLYQIHIKATNAVATGGTVTFTFSSTSGRKAVIGSVVTGLDSTSYLDQVGVGANDITTSPTITTGTLATANSLILTHMFITSPLASITEDSDYAWIDDAIFDNRTLHLATREVNSTSPDTYNPSLAASASWMLNYIVLKGAGATPPVTTDGDLIFLFGVGD